MLKIVNTNTNVKKSVKYVFLMLTAFYIYSIYTRYVSNGVNFVNPNIKYILQWTSPYTEPFAFMGKGQDVFLKHKCLVNNCYITSNRKFMKKITDFDAILFHGPELHRHIKDLPKIRSSHQMYVFASMESSHYYPVLDEIFYNFFNWTWTYKLNSDMYYGYMIIRNKHGDVIGPKKEMHWLKTEEMEPINNTLMHELMQKNASVSWLVSNCNTPGKREVYVKKLNHELAKYNMSVKTFGRCGTDACPRNDLSTSCESLIKRFYYFYLSFENSFSEDYVTEKLLTPLFNNAVPIVYGGANYTRFLPDGAYLDARKLGIADLAKTIVNTIKDKQKYYDFFRWRNHYSYHNVTDDPETNYYCKVCSKLNEKMKANVNNKSKVSFYKNFQVWWNQ